MLRHPMRQVRPDDESLFAMALIAPVGDGPVFLLTTQRIDDAMTIQQSNRAAFGMDVKRVDDDEGRAIEGRRVPLNANKLT